MAKCVNGMYSVGCNIDDVLAEEKLKQLKELIQRITLPSNFLSGINYNISMADMWAERYQDAYDRFMTIIRKDMGAKCMFFICYCCDRMHKKYPRELMEIDYSDEYMSSLLEYYKMKARSCDDELLIRHIMNVILPQKLVFMDYTHPLWVIFDYELLNIGIRKTKYKKYYLEYHKKMIKICKDA